MVELLLLKLRREEDEHSAELRFLLSFCAGEARAALGAEPHLALLDPTSAPPALPAARRVLLLGPEPVLVGRASLAAMAAALEDSRLVVSPAPLSSSGLPGLDRLHTLRAFEALERVHLERAAGTGDVASALPVSLWSGEAFRSIAGNRSSTEPWSTTLPGQLAMRSARVGLYHEFVDYYGQEREDVLPFIPEGTRRVLEIGCGRGATGRLLQERYGCEVTGVEHHPGVAREAARRLHRVIRADVETLELDERFDVVLALELFEHLVDGDAFLDRARRWVEPGGRIVLSVPNVGHYALVEDLLAGRWDYLPIGLLCVTHLRFFTRVTLERWLRRCGFEKIRIEARRGESPAWLGELPEGLATDPDSLRTLGFFAILQL